MNGARPINRIAPITPPNIEASAACRKAIAPFPFRINMFPSYAVITAQGAPGIFTVMAVILPPYWPPMKIAAHITSDEVTSIEYVIGRIRAIARVPVKPGIAAKQVPIKKPATR